MVLSLQGCMAVGKSTAARFIMDNAPEITVCLEDNRMVIEEIRRSGLKKDQYQDYLEIQRLFLRNEIRRWESVQHAPCAVMDFGAEEILFYTLSYPAAIGRDWEVERALEPELEAARRCMPERILFLNAKDETLKKRMGQDATRSREFFPFYLERLLPLKRDWFFNRRDVDILETDGLTALQAGGKALDWVRQYAAQR